MGLASVHISGELWQEIMTVGWKAGAGEIVKCIEGLPEGAMCKSVFYEGWPAKTRPLSAPDLVFVFEHPDFDEVVEGGAISAIDIVHQRFYSDE